MERIVNQNREIKACLYLEVTLFSMLLYDLSGSKFKFLVIVVVAVATEIDDDRQDDN